MLQPLSRISLAYTATADASLRTRAYNRNSAVKPHYLVGIWPWHKKTRLLDGALDAYQLLPIAGLGALDRPFLFDSIEIPAAEINRIGNVCFIELVG